MRSFVSMASGMRRTAAMKPRSVGLTQRRNFGAGGGGGEPHVPKGYAALGKCMLVSCYLWIFYRMKEDKGQLFGLYKPWHHPHEHVHVAFVEGENKLGGLPSEGTAHGHHDEEE